MSLTILSVISYILIQLSGRDLEIYLHSIYGEYPDRKMYMYNRHHQLFYALFSCSLAVSFTLVEYEK